MGGGGGVIGAIIGAVVAIVGVITENPQLIAMGLTMMASSVVSALTAPKMPTSNGFNNLNTGTNLQIQPATNNKLPVVYGNCYIGGTITDLSITTDNQNLYYVLSLCEVTGNGTDGIGFGNIYYGGKLCLFSGLSYTDSGVHITNISGNTITSNTGKIGLGSISSVVLTGGNAYDLVYTDGNGNLAFGNLNSLSGLDGFTGNNISLGTNTLGSINILSGGTAITNTGGALDVHIASGSISIGSADKSTFTYGSSTKSISLN